MAPPEDAAETGGHISGVGMCKYMETFYARFLEQKATFQFETEILSVKRVDVKNQWEVRVEDVRSPGQVKVLNFARIILATGVRGARRRREKTITADRMVYFRAAAPQRYPRTCRSTRRKVLGFLGLCCIRLNSERGLMISSTLSSQKKRTMALFLSSEVGNRPKSTSF